MNDYLEKVAEPGFPSPASGSASATAAAMAAALLEMSYEVTMLKDAPKKNLKEPLEHIRAIRKHCLLLATEDMRAYAEVVKAAKVKKEFPDGYEEAMKKATDTLAAIVKNCEIILTQMEQVVDICYPKVLGDLGGGAYMAEAAAAAAKYGVEVNLKLMQDKHFIKDVKNLVQESYRRSTGIKERIIATVAVDY